MECDSVFACAGLLEGEGYGKKFLFSVLQRQGKYKAYSYRNLYHLFAFGNYESICNGWKHCSLS